MRNSAKEEQDGAEMGRYIIYTLADTIQDY